MDEPLIRLANANGIRTTGTHKWPEKVDEDIKKFVSSPEARAIFVVEATDGLIIGPPPRGIGVNKTLVVVKMKGAIPEDNWEEFVIATAMPLSDGAMFSYLHAMLTQTILPLFDSVSTSAGTQARHKIVEAERALEQLSQHSQIAFVDLLNGVLANRATTALIKLENEKDDPTATTHDLNELQSVVNLWKQQVTKLVASNRDAREGSASDEIGFWIALETALRNVIEQLSSPSIKEIWSALEDNKRFHATRNFSGDTGLSEAYTRVQGYTQILFREIPLGELLASSSVDHLINATYDIFGHINRKLRSSGYPAQRCVEFVEAIGRDFGSVLLKICESELEKALDMEDEDAALESDHMHAVVLKIAEFTQLVQKAADAWDSVVREFATLIRDLMRKRAERFIVVKVNASHQPLVTRVFAIRTLAAKHGELRPLIASDSTHAEALDDVFHSIIASHDLLTMDDSEWRHLESKYSREAQAAEMEIAEKLKSRLEAAEDSGNPDQILDVFARHQAILVRPQVRAVTHRFQSSLLDLTKEEVFRTERSLQMLPEKDLVQRVMKIQQIKLRIDEIRNRLSFVIGEDWKEHVEAAHIGSACDIVERALDPEGDIKSWVEEFLNTNNIGKLMSLNILTVTDRQINAPGFANETHVIFRTLKSLGFRFDLALSNLVDTLVEANIARERIMDCIETIFAVSETLTSYPRIQSCNEVFKYSTRVVELIISGITELTWSNEGLAKYVTSLEHESALLDDTVAEIADTDVSISDLMNEAQDVDLENDLAAFKKQVYDLSYRIMSPNYSSAVVNDVKFVVAKKMAYMLSNWRPSFQKVRIEIRNQELLMKPSLAECLEYWFNELNTIVLPTSMAADIVPEILKTNFVTAVKTVWAAWKAGRDEAEQWKSFQILWELRKDHVLASLRNISEPNDGTFDPWLVTIDQLRQSQMYSPPSDSRLIFDTKEVAMMVEAKSDDWQDALLQNLANDVMNRSILLLDASRLTRRNLESSRIDTRGVILKELQFLHEGEVVMSSLKHWLPSLTGANRILNTSRCALPTNWVSSDLLQSELTAIESIVQRRSSDLETAKPNILRELEARTASLVGEVHNLSAHWDANKPLQSNVDPESALKTLSNMSTQLMTVSNELQTVAAAFASLSCNSPSTLDELMLRVREWSLEVENLSTSWSDIAKGWSEIQQVGSQKFFSVTSEKLSRDFSSLESFITNLPAQSKEMPAYQKLRNQFNQLIASGLPNILTLKGSPAIRPHHLVDLAPDITSSIAEDPSLSEIWLKLPSNDIVRSVVDTAEGEYRLLQYIDTVKKKWDALILTGSGNYIRNLDVVLPLINDHTAAFKAMCASPYFKTVSSVVQEWERKLGAAKQVFDLFADAQQQYIYLNGVLMSTAVSGVLPNEARRFKGFAEEFTELYTQAESRAALEFANTPRLSVNLTRLLNQFAVLHKSLSGYMETQRQRLPRLFFVGDDDLLEIVGTPLNSWEFKHINSIFPGISRIDFENQCVLSAEGETLHIDTVGLETQDNIELLILLDKKIKEALKRSIFEAVSKLSDVWGDVLKFEKWLELTPVQSVTVALRIHWSKTVLKRSGVNDITDLEMHYNNLLQRLPHVGDDSLLWARRKESAIAELIYEQQNLDPKYPHLLLGVEIRDDDVYVCKSTDIWLYGYEYLGTPEPIVRTTITDNLYFSATAALAQGKGVSVVGPAGTGKTETVKSLGSIMGRRVVVFNCDDQFDYQAVLRMLAGCGSTQSWVCFDEFNRLSRSTLSSIAQVVNDSLKKTPVFVTMNPGYTGRTILPPNMKEEFREFVLATPESKEIARVILYSHEGGNPECSEKVVELLQTLDEKLSNQSHYDWGLRAMKGILRVSILLKGDVRSACIVAIRPMLFAQDTAIFDTELTNLFGNAKESKEIQLADKVLLEDPKIEHNLRDYIVSLDIFRKFYAGTMLLGPTGCGKTKVWKELARIHDAETIVIDPSALPKTALLGHLDPITREWTDGLLSSVIRRINANLRGERAKKWFFVFDGEIEPSWAEALNSLLDDNHHLSLANGEILHLPSQLHLIFETTNLDAATPATVSRCGMICLPVYTTKGVRAFPQNVLEVARRINHAMEFIEVQSYETYEKLNIGSKWLSMAWALAGDSDEDGRLALSNAIRDAADDDAMLPKSGSLTDYYVSELTGRWHSWKDCVSLSSGLDADAINRPDLLIPTVDTVCHEAILQAALTSRRPLILVGPPGSGKTMTLYSALRQMPSHVANLIPLNFSSTASPELIVQALELYCEYSTGPDGEKTLAPSGSRWAVLFIDEVNLPQPNDYNVVPVLQFLRHLIEYSGFHDSTGHFIKVERIQLVAACNPPPLRRPLPPALLRHFITVQVGYPKQDALSTIYTALLTTMDPKSVLLVEPMLRIYEALPRILPDESWTPRELTRWIRSINTSWNAVTEAQRSQILLWKIWLYEAQRVLCDRLKKLDRVKVDALIMENVSEQINIPIGEIWSYFISQRPKFVQRNELKQFLRARVSLFMDEAACEGDENLVVHNDFVDHLSRLDRIMRQPQGHALLVGPPSVGKTTLVRFTCWLTDIALEILRTHSKYSETDFCQDLRRILLQSLRRPVCLLLGEDLFSKPDFVELMNSLLANAEVPGLFSTPEQLTELEESARHAGFTGGDIISWFRARAVANVHIVFVATETSGASPALLNRCVVDRVSPWSKDIKEEIARHWCSSTDAPQTAVDLLSSSFYADFAVHEGNQAFIESCRQFEKAYNRRKRQLEDSQRHFVSGSDRIKSAVLEIKQLKRTLDKRRDQLAKENEKSSALLSQMLHEQSEAERKRVAAVEIRAAVQMQTVKIEERQQIAHDDLAATEPLIKQAAEGVQNIKKSQLNELRALLNPPEPVKITLEAVCLALGLKTDGSWKQVLTAVRGDEFIPRIVHFDSSKMSEQLISKIEQEYMSRANFTYERVDRASKAGGPLLRWVVAQVAYGRAIAAVKPLMEEIDMLNSEAEKSRAQLFAIEEMLEDLEIAIDKSKTDYSHAVAQCESLKSDMQSISLQLERAESLMESLSEEKERWSQAAAEFPIKLSSLPQEALIEAAHVAYGGQLDPMKVAALESLVLKKFNSEKPNLANLISHDDLKLETIVYQSWSVVLVVDPANSWDPATESTNLKISSFLSDSDTLGKELDMALRFGQHLVIKHAERFDPIALPILTREFLRKGARLLVKLGSGDVDVSPGFKLTLHTRDFASVKHTSPLLVSKVNIVDFSITEAKFKHMVSKALLQAQFPELAERKDELKRSQIETSMRLGALESELLSALSGPTNDKILEDHVLIDSLEKLKSESKQLKAAQVLTDETLNDLNKVAYDFESSAQYAASIYRRVSELRSVNKFYAINVDWLWDQVTKCASASQFNDAFTTEINRRVLSVLNQDDWEKYWNLESEPVERMNLIDIIKETPSEKPIIAGLATSNASDPADLIQTQAVNSSGVSITCSIVPMGSIQACRKADRVLSQALDLGEWVVIQNVEVANDDWLRNLTRQIQTSKAHQDFRLILTGQQADIIEIPDLVSFGRTVSVERERGVKVNIMRSLTDTSDMTDFALCYIHACFCERFSSIHLGESDLAAARWTALRIMTGEGQDQLSTLRQALLISVWGAKTGEDSIKHIIKQFMTQNLVAPSVFPQDFRSWLRQLPGDVDWLPKSLTI